MLRKERIEGEDMRKDNANIAVEAVQEIPISATTSKKRNIEAKEPKQNQPRNNTQDEEEIRTGRA